jgi:hypothetical protein
VFQQDIIKRLIEQIGQLIAAALSRAEEGHLKEADDELDQAEAALGLPRGYKQLDSRSVTVLLRGSEKAELLAQIYDTRARIRRMNHQLDEALHLEARATELRRASESS